MVFNKESVKYLLSVYLRVLVGVSAIILHISFMDKNLILLIISVFLWIGSWFAYDQVMGNEKR